MFYFLLRRPIARRASLQYLEKFQREYPDSLPGKPGLWLVFRHFLAFGRSLLDKYVAWSGELMSIAGSRRLVRFVRAATV